MLQASVFWFSCSLALCIKLLAFCESVLKAEQGLFKPARGLCHAYSLYLHAQQKKKKLWCQGREPSERKPRVVSNGIGRQNKPLSLFLDFTGSKLFLRVFKSWGLVFHTVPFPTHMRTTFYMDQWPKLMCSSVHLSAPCLGKS